jgi:hypothetical protein
MKKLSLLIACFTLPLAALAADGQPAQPAAQASAAPVAKSASDSHAAVRNSKANSSRMSVCRLEAKSQNLMGEAFKAAVATCMK